MSSLWRRNGPKKTFYGYPNYSRPECTGKQDLEGTAWGCDADEPYDLDEQGSSMFRACINDGFIYEEVADIGMSGRGKKRTTIRNN